MNSLVKNIESAIKEAFEEFAGLIVTKYNLDMGELVELWNESCNSIELTVKKLENKTSSVISKKTITTTPKETKSVITPIPSSNTSDCGGCKHIMIRGERKGENCGVKTSKNSSYCLRHKKSETDEKVTTKKVEKLPPGTIIARRNKDLDAFWHQETGFVFKSATDQQVIGKCIEGQMVPLSEDDIELCKSMNLTYSVEEVIEEKKVITPPKTTGKITSTIEKKVTTPAKTLSKITSVKSNVSKLTSIKKEDSDDEKTMTVIKKITSVPTELVKGAKEIKKSINKITTSEDDSDVEEKKEKKTILQKNTNAKTSTAKKTTEKVTKSFKEGVEDFIKELQGEEDIESGPEDIEEEELLEEEDD
jgi:hypothetical protein